LSIASRMRSVSHIVTMFEGADTVIDCCLLTGAAGLASRLAHQCAMSTGSRRMVMSKASAIASEIRWSTIESALGGARIWSTWEVMLSFDALVEISSVQHLGAAEDDAERVLQIVGDGAENLVLETVGALQRQTLRRQAAVGLHQPRGCAGDAVLELGVGFVQLLIKDDIVERDRQPLPKISTSERSVSDNCRSACSSTTTSRPLRCGCRARCADRRIRAGRLRLLQPLPSAPAGPKSHRPGSALDGSGLQAPARTNRRSAHRALHPHRSGREVVVLLQAERQIVGNRRSLVEDFRQPLSIAFDMSSFISSCTKPHPARGPRRQRTRALMQANRRLSAQWLRLQRANGFKNEILGTVAPI